MEEWNPVRIICPQCGKRNLGYKNARGDCKLCCPNCKSVMFSRRKTPTKRVILITTFNQREP